MDDVFEGEPERGNPLRRGEGEDDGAGADVGGAARVTAVSTVISYCMSPNGVENGMQPAPSGGSGKRYKRKW